MKATVSDGLAVECVVYGLYDPRTKAIRYIGQTVRSARQRLYGHLGDAKRHEHTHVARWIADLASVGLRPTVEVLERCHSAEVLGDRERYWIALARERGESLTNITDGGDGGVPGWVPTEETRHKFKQRRNVWRGRKHTEESKRLMSLNCQRAWQSPELRAAQSARRKGKTLSDAQRAAASEATKRCWMRPEYRSRRAATLASSVKWKDGHARRSAALTGRKRDAVVVAAIAAKRRQPVIDQFGNIYPSLKGAAHSLGVSAATMSAVVNGHRAHTHGYVFRLHVPTQEFR